MGREEDSAGGRGRAIRAAAKGCGGLLCWESGVLPVPTPRPDPAGLTGAACPNGRLSDGSAHSCFILNKALKALVLNSEPAESSVTHSY